MDRQLLSVRRIVAEGVVTAIGLILIWVVFRSDPTWFKRHVLPDFFRPRSEQLQALEAVRLGGLVVAAAVVLFVRPWAGRFFERRTAAQAALAIAPYGVALVLALAITEFALHRLPWRAAHQAPVGREPVRHWDDRLGWVYVPNRTGHGVIGGRNVAYAFDAAGHRVRSAAEPVDYAAPSIVFVGESIIAGNGLTYDETIPARVGALTGHPVANLAVGGYATDQMYLRLKDEWPRFTRPTAVVALFMPSLFFRSLDDDRPHLDPGLTWRPTSAKPRLVQVARRVYPPRTEAEIAQAEANVREQLAGIVALARSKGATPLIVAPEFGPESGEEAAIRRRILDASGVPYVRAPIDASWRLPNNSHPNARGADAIARAVVAGLVAHGLQPVQRAAPHADGQVS